MRSRRTAWIVFVALAMAPTAHGQDFNFRAAAPNRREAFSEPIPITLGRPQAINEGDAVATIRGQMGDMTPPIPAPPPFTGGAPLPPGPLLGGPVRNEEDYNCGRVNNDSDQQGWWARTTDKVSRCWQDLTGSVGGAFAGSTTRSRFQSDHCFDYFISPVTNPHLFEDPRALTELRPVFEWQRTPNSNYIFQGGNNFNADLQARVALTERISIVLNRLGWVWTDVANPQQGVQTGNGFSEVNIGPKFTFIREETTKSVVAGGVTFELPVGSAQVNQDTGNLSIVPYASFAQHFGEFTYGSFNFMATPGYSFRTDNQRTEFFFLSGHLDYDFRDLHVFYPLVEVNWTRYTRNGNVRDIGFEGNNLFNFGSAGVAGHSDLNVAVGFRYLFSQHIQFGLAGEMNVLGGSRHLDMLRVTADMIFRY